MTRRGLILMGVMLGVWAFTSSAAAAEPSTVSVSVSPTPTVGQPVQIVVSGTSSQAGVLAAYIFAGYSPCPSVLPKGEIESEHGPVLTLLAPPTQVSAGSYSQTYGITPFVSFNWIVCAYLYDPSNSNLIYAVGTSNFYAQGAPAGTSGSPGTNGSTGFTTAPTHTEPKPTPPHLTRLTVRVRERTGHTAAEPGVTDIVIQTLRAFDVHVVLKRQGRSKTRVPVWSSDSQGTVAVPWTCSRPGSVYTYTVTARDSYRKTLTRRGEFRPVSAARCRVLKAAGQHGLSQHRT
jgi:hypothetical protein